MDNDRTQKENPLTYKYVKILRWFLYPLGGWPGDALGEKVSLIVRYHRKHLVVQASFVFIGQIFYMVKYWNQLSFLLKGHCLITAFLAIVTITRSSLPNFKTYAKIMRNFLMTFHLGHFRHKGKYYQEMCTTIDKASYYFTLYMAFLTFASMLLFNAVPCYQNYKNGIYTGKSLNNATAEFSLYYAFPGFKPHEHITFVTLLNIHASFVCSNYFCVLDLLLCVMIFQIIGHVQILRHNLATLPKPLKRMELETHRSNFVTHQYNFETHQSNFGKKTTVTVEMYDAEENQMIHEKLVEYVLYHKMIVSFTGELSEFFGPVLGINYASHLFCCCLLLLECVDGGIDAVVCFGAITVGIFGQLIQISVIFEIIGTVSEKLIDSVYDTPWECMNTSNRRTICILLQRVQDPIHVTAMGLTAVGVNTMAAILRTTFSYFTFLKSMHD